MACTVMVAGFAPVLGGTLSVCGFIVVARLIGNSLLVSILKHFMVHSPSAAAGLCTVNDFLDREVGGRLRSLAGNIEVVSDG